MRLHPRVAVLAVALADAARAEPQDVLPEPLRRLYEEGAELEARGAYGAAATAYRVVADNAPNWHGAALDLGRVLVADGRIEAALELYASMPYDADAVEASGRLLAREGRGAEAAVAFRKLRDLRPEWPGSRLLEAEARADAEPDLAASLVLEYVGFEGIDGTEADVVATTRTVAVALRDQGQHAAALELLHDVLDWLADRGDDGLRTLTTELEVDEASRALAEAADVPLTPDQVQALQGAREAYAAGRHDEARAALEVLVKSQPLSAVAWATLADVREATNDIAGAEQAVRAAERLDPVNASYPAKLGDLLSERYAGRYDTEAAAAYARAVQRRPDDAELWFRCAVAERRAGHWARSIPSYERVVALDPAGPHADEARRAIEGSERQRPDAVELPGAGGPPNGVPDEAWWAFHRAWAWTRRPEPDAMDRALAELAVARAAAPGFVRAIDLEASIRADRGEIDRAIAAYERSLALEPDRGEVIGTLARLYHAAGRPDDAAQAAKRAAQLGDPDALWHRAQAEASSWRWSAARATLASFFAHTSGGPAYEQALQLDVDLATRIQRARIGAGAVGVGLVLLPFAVWARSRSGAPLSALVAREPQCWRDVARICSAIRHEVLKHHTSVLGGVADALDRGDPEPARWVAERLFGPAGALAQLDAYVDELAAVGRANGVPLNLAVRDPVFRPMLASVRRLRKLRRGLERGGSSARDRRLPSELRTVANALNHVASNALAHQIASLCVLEVSYGLVRAVVDGVRDEPAFRDRRVPPIDVEVLPEDPLLVRVFRADLADVLANLVRNAIEATADDGRIAVIVEVDEDAITAIESVVIRVCDPAPGQLTTAMLRGRYVARGLGLALDLTNRAGGSLSVEPAAGWAKALVVRLPRAEAPSAREEAGT